MTMSKVQQAGFARKISDSVSSNKKLLLVLFCTLLLVAAVVSIVAGVTISRNNAHHESQHAIIKTACSSTPFPDLCFSSIASEPALLTQKAVVSSRKDVLLLVLNVTTGNVQRNYFTIEKLLNKKGLNLTKREKCALHDCLETIDETLYHLQKAKDDLKDYPRSSSNKSLYQHADDLKTVISSAITNQGTCLEGFSHSKAEKHFRKYLQAGQVHVERLCRNALAITTNLTNSDIANYENNMGIIRRNKLLALEEDGIRWPEWIPAADRRLLQSSSIRADVVVAADGSGDYRTVSAAVAAAPERSSRRYVIRIKAGVYRENVEVPSRKTNIMFLGDGSRNTIITASRNVVDGFNLQLCHSGATAFVKCVKQLCFHLDNYTKAIDRRYHLSIHQTEKEINLRENHTAIVGEGFLARGISFENSAGPSKHQAVALRVGSDLAAFYLCGFSAFQDTLYVHSNRQFFVNCFIAGTIDFIFGNSAAVFQDCDIHARRPNPGQKNMVTAQGRVDPNQNTGIVIQKCRIGATADLEPVKGSFPTYLGRPWKEYSRTVVMQSTIGDVIHPAGWFEWDGNFALDTLFYGEYANTGPGADTSRRVNWRGFRVITSASEARAFTAANFIAGSGWLGSTGFPHSLGL